MNPRLIAKKQSRHKPKPSLNDQNKPINASEKVDKSENLLDLEVSTATDPMTAEQLSEIKSLHRIHDQLFYEIYNPFVLLFVVIFMYKSYKDAAPKELQEVFSRFHLLGFLTAIKVVIDQLAFKHPIKFSGIPVESKLTTYTYKDADNLIKILREKNTNYHEMATIASSAGKKLIVMCFSFVLLDIFSFSTLHPGMLLLSSCFIIGSMPNWLSKANQYLINYDLDNKLINLKENLNELTDMLGKKWILHQNPTLENSYFVLSLKHKEFSSKLLFQIINLALKRHNITTTTTKNFSQIVINADIKLNAEKIAKIKKDIESSIQAFSDLEVLKNQLYIIADKMGLFFIFNQGMNNLTPTFFAHSSKNDRVSIFAYDNLAKLFLHNEMNISDTSIRIQRTSSIPEDKFNAFLDVLNNETIFIESQPTPTLPLIESHTSSAPKPKMKRPPEDKAVETTETEDKAPNIKVPTTPLNLKQPSKWASGASYDYNKPAEQQEVKPFISSNLPKDKFFMVSLLTKKDFEISSLTYLEDHFMQQMAYPTLARKRNDQGVVLNLFGIQHDAQGNPYNINGKIKCKGDQIGDIRAYFDYETNEYNQVLCRVKNIKFKAHKQR